MKMNDFIEKVEYIKSCFINGGFENLSNKLTEVQLSSGTPGEVFAGIVYNLNEIKNNNISAYELSRDKINDIIEYAKSINYLQ